MTRFGLITLLTLLLMLANGVSIATAQNGEGINLAAAGSVGPEGDFLHAQRLYQEGMYDYAASELERYLNAYPNHHHAGEAALLLADALRAQDLIPQARNAYQRAAVYLTDSTLAVEALHSAAEMDLLLGDTTRAIDSYLAVQVLYPDGGALPRTLIRAAKLQLATRQWQAAERSLSILLREFPGTEWESEARLLLAQGFAGQRDMAPAIESARSVAMHTTNDSLKVRAGLLLGRWELANLNPPAAMQIWSQVLEGMADVSFASEVALELARLHERSAEYYAADEMYQRALQMETDSTQIISIQIEHADLFFLMDRYQEALKLYRDADSLGTIQRQRWCTEHMWAHAIPVEMSELRHPELNGQDGITAQSLLDDERLWLKATDYAESGQPDEARRKYLNYAHSYPVSPLSGEARKRAEYLRDYVIKPVPSDDDLVDLLNSFGDRPGDPNARLKLAEYYLETIKRPLPAIALLVPLMSRQDLPDRMLPRVQERYTDAVWMEWQHTSHDAVGAQLEMTDSLRSEAQSAIQRMTAAFATESALHADSERAWRVNTLREIANPVLSTRARLQRAMWAGYLFLHPESKHADEVRLRLVDAWSVKLEGDDVAEMDSLRLDQLDTLITGEANTSTRRKALLLLHEYFSVLDSTAIADSLARVLFAGEDSPEKLEIAWFWLRDRPEAPEASKAMEWIIENTWYHPEYLMRAPHLADRLLGLSGMSWNTDGDAVPADSMVRSQVARFFDWAIRIKQYEPEIVEPKFVRGDRVLLRGLKYEAEGRTLDAILDYTAYLRPGNETEWTTMVALRLARLYDLAGHWEQAQPLYIQALHRAPEDATLQPLRRSLARWALDAGQYEQATEWAKEASRREVNTDTAFVLDELAIVSMYRAGDLEQAGAEASTFEGWYKDHPSLDEAMAHFALELGRYHSSQGQYDSSLRAYKSITGKYKKTSYEPNARYEIARDYMEQGEAEKAYEMLIELANDSPEHPVMGQVYWLLGNYYASTGKYFEAFNKYEAVLADSAYIAIWPQVLGNQIRAFKEAGFYEGAMRAARQFLEMYPDSEDAFDHRMNLALSYHETGHYDLAISQFRRAMTLADGEDYPACQFYIAEALERSGRLKEAVSEYMRVVHLNRPSKLQWGITAMYNAGKVLERLNEPERAKSLYREIVRREGLGSPFGRRADEQVKRLEMFEQDQAEGGQ